MFTSHFVEALNAHALLSRFGVLVRQGHEGNANLLHHIEAIDRRQLWANRGLRHDRCGCAVEFPPLGPSLRHPAPASDVV